MIDIKNLSVSYRKHSVLQNLSLTLEKGRLTTIIGPNGSGKSTLLKAILGMIPHTNGDILINGKNLSSMKRIEIAKSIAYLSQGRLTPDMTVGQAVLHGRFPHLKYPRIYTANDEKIAYAAMTRVGIEEHAQKPISSLSGGMKQSAYIAMALAQKTEYILLDEPTTYLDVAHQLELMRILQSLTKEGIGIAAVMHDLPMALSFSDNVAVLANGKIAYLGSPTELCKTDVIKNVFGISISCKNSEYHYNLNDI